MRITIELNDKEAITIERMATKLELSPVGVLRQALRLYDAIDLGAFKVEPTKSMLKLSPLHEVKNVK